VATFGIEWTKEQARLLRAYPKRFVMFDSDRAEAVNQAKKLAWYLAGFGGGTEFVDLKGGRDPGDLDDAVARQLMVELIGG
jgi:DNA primase